MPCRYCLPHCLICGITSSAARCDGDSVSAATWYSSTTEAAYWSTLDMAESSLQIHRPFPKKVECLRSPTAHVSSVNQASFVFPAAMRLEDLVPCWVCAGVEVAATPTKGI